VKSDLAFTAYDSVDLVTPFLEQGAVFIMTKLRKTQGQTRLGFGSWTPSPTTGGVTLTTDVENFKIQYSAFAVFPLIDPTGEKRFQTRGFNSAPDPSFNNVISVKELLTMAKTDYKTVASTGGVFQVTVFWDCLLLSSECIPELKVSRLDPAKSGFSLWKTHHYTTTLGKQRDVEEITGIRFIWKPAGTGNQIDFVSIIFYLAAGAALLPIANIVTEAVMMYVLPERKHYSSRIIEETPDYNMLDELADKREEEEKRRKDEQSAVDVESLFAADDDI